MPVDWGRVQALHVIKRDWRIDEETEQASTPKIPKRDCNKKVNRPFVCCNPNSLLAGPCQSDMFPCLETDEYQWHDFQCTENRSEAEHYVGGPSEIKVMECADDSA